MRGCNLVLKRLAYIDCGIAMLGLLSPTIFQLAIAEPQVLLRPS